MSRSLRSIVIVSIAALLAACHGVAPPLTQDAYIWQRQWTPALRLAVNDSKDIVGQWRVLVAQADGDGQLNIFAPDLGALAASGRPVVAVVRIDGRLADMDRPAFVDRIADLSRQWSGKIAGIEIDYDCATARLPAYAHFLSTLKSRLPDVHLSITALPTWLSSGELDAVTASVDEVVLQVHAVQSPKAGLFDPVLARRWVDEFASRMRKPFRVALPTYGSRVSWDEEGRMLAVESEKAGLAPGALSAELSAAPRDVARFLGSLRDDPPRGLAGIVWFRLPTTDDRRAWSLSTWRAVMRGEYVEGRIATVFSESATPGAMDVVLRNDGDIDAVAPSEVALPDGCPLADGIGGYALRRDGRIVQLATGDSRFLRAHTQRTIGWIRCASPSVSSAVANDRRDASRPLPSSPS